jgi:hypothetical protein
MVSPMVLSPGQDIDRRRRVWSALARPLFDFACDEEPTIADFQAISRVVVECGYTEDEIHAIYWAEVVPAIAGNWCSFDPIKLQWLEHRIIHPPRFGHVLTCFFRPWWILVAHEYWRKITNAIKTANPRTTDGICHE